MMMNRKRLFDKFSRLLDQMIVGLSARDDLWYDKYIARHVKWWRLDAELGIAPQLPHSRRASHGTTDDAGSS
jgi:hypothetical protein